ncbi:hypothetical protein [Novosphingobium sp. PhB57]|uniref:hypothetical protein n=1 Tax=Novosphingobium sp. PhB57 TaxID=2485107 RepID=UPI00104C4DF1|nr:hypothetical protein [Novosphingobium sp. PhB57]
MEIAAEDSLLGARRQWLADAEAMLDVVWSRRADGRSAFPAADTLSGAGVACPLAAIVAFSGGLDNQPVEAKAVVFQGEAERCVYLGVVVLERPAAIVANKYDRAGGGSGGAIGVERLDPPDAALPDQFGKRAIDLCGIEPFFSFAGKARQVIGGRWV